MDDVERLHYVNGRRLEASDFRLEQHYLVAMRRRLNSGLFTPGVVDGFGVSQLDATHVRVAPGLALDPDGREILLSDHVDLPVPAQPPPPSLGGYFLVACYEELPLAGEDPDCVPATTEAARIREQPRLVWTEDLPFASLCGEPNAGPLDCAVALALVSLDASCQIQLVDISPRDIARPAQASQVQAFAFEGEKDIDADNPKRLRFAIRGGAAASVVLYLWADRFSSLYYTQLGQHRHTLSGWSVSTEQTDLAAHTHDLQNHTHGLPDTAGAGDHNHAVRMHRTALPAKSDRLATVFPPVGGNVGWVYGSPAYIQAEGGHGHSFVDSNGNPVPTAGPSPNSTGAFSSANPSQTHTHVVSANVDRYGSPTYGDAATGAAYGYFGGLIVELDGKDVTQHILDVLPLDFNRALGDTTNGHPLVTRGTPGIELTTVARAAGKVLDSSRTHELTFKLAGGGGKLLYNLFVS